jgi:hypothetical protein
MTPQIRNCVVAGRFNPAILSPSWIVAHGVLPEGEFEGSNLLGTNIIQYTLGGLTWQPTLNKLEVTANDDVSDPGEFVAKVLELLPHTPIAAVGSNFAIPVSPEDGRRLFPLIESRLHPLTADADHEMLEYSVTIALKFDSDCVVSIHLSSEKEVIDNTHFNFNRFVPNASAGAEVAMNWRRDEAEALRLYAKIIGTKT